MMDGASELCMRGKNSKGKDEGQAKEAELFKQLGKFQMELECLKKISAALTPMNSASWLIRCTLSSVSVANVRWWSYPCSTHHYLRTSLRVSTFRITARIDAFYLDAPLSGCRRVVEYLAMKGIPTSRAWVPYLLHPMWLRSAYQKPRTTVQGELSERFPCLVELKPVTAVD